MQLAYVSSRILACPDQGNLSHAHLAFLQESNALIAYVHTEWNTAISSPIDTRGPNIPCSLYWSSCKNSNCCHSSQSGCFNNLPLVRHITGVITLRTSSDWTKSYLGLLVQRWSATVENSHLLLSWSWVFWENGVDDTIGIPSWDKLGLISGWKKRREAEGHLFVSKLQKTLLTSSSDLTVISPILISYTPKYVTAICVTELRVCFVKLLPDERDHLSHKDWGLQQDGWRNQICVDPMFAWTLRDKGPETCIPLPCHVCQFWSPRQVQQQCCITRSVLYKPP